MNIKEILYKFYCFFCIIFNKKEKKNNQIEDILNKYSNKLMNMEDEDEDIMFKINEAYAR